MKMTDEGIAHIRRSEGCRLDAYLDQAGVWTIGWGHAETSGRPPIPHRGMTITQEQADRIFADDMRHFADQIRPLIKIDATPSQFSAMVSLAFNIGVGSFAGSTALKRLNAGDIAGAADAITWWNKVTIGGKKVVSNGLVARRAREVELFLSDGPGLDMRQTPDEPRKNPGQSTTMQAAGTAAAGAATAAGTAIGQLDGTAQVVVIGAAFVILLAALWIMRERVRKWAGGDR